MRLLSLLAISAGCAPELASPPPRAAAPERADPDAVLTFGADWTQSASGRLVDGATVRVDYDVARLPQCRGRQFGRDAWAITGYWRVGTGPVSTFAIVQGSMPPETTFVATGAGELELWFENTDVFGCHAWDSNYGANYRFPLLSSAVEPDWVGDASVAIARATCDGGPCDADLRPLDGGFTYDTWARQRAAVAEATFRVWEPGLTDRPNPDLWQELDVRAYWRFSPDDEYSWDWVDFDRNVGNDARYALPLRSIDPLGRTIVDPADCPPVVPTSDPQYVDVPVELYFSVNGDPLRADDGGAFRGTFRDYAGPYAVCL